MTMSERALSRVKDISPEQKKYLEDLLIDTGMGERKTRNAYLSLETGREIKFVDDVKFHEAMRIINELKELRDRKRKPVVTDEDSDEG